MFALSNCNNFYASCHRLFEPKYNGVPVVVLSNNDGCVIARSNEAKACGIAMGAPFFKIREEIKKHNVEVFSSHYTLYGDISARVMTNLARFTPDVEVYSIDECFLGLWAFIVCFPEIGPIKNRKKTLLSPSPKTSHLKLENRALNLRFQ
ncbi:hypothetical protein ACFOG5_24425 [Pedobacter fastidiosus]|uniref:UmuC domain-containing protein n=1 Tax=Pedobacter fastidiosus TaxID=2765361 RepID=A0ABR7KXD4_9SPHI|nr:hypothetical protein [Pedobacter fastidiosus]